MMRAKRDPRLDVLAAAVEWYQCAVNHGDEAEIEKASVALYVAHGAPFGSNGDAGANGYAIWIDFQEWTTGN